MQFNPFWRAMSFGGMSAIVAGCLLFTYYLCGVAVFVPLERPEELAQYEKNRDWRQGMHKLYQFHQCEDPAFQDLSICTRQGKFHEISEKFFSRHGNAIEDTEKWTVLGTLFFLTQLATSIGYGGVAPVTDSGKLATICFGIIGLPIMGFTIMQIAQFQVSCIAKLRDLGWLQPPPKGPGEVCF